MPQLERRFVVVADLTFDESRHRSAMPEIVGTPIVYNTLSDDLGGFREKVSPKATLRALAEKQDIRGLFNHDPNMVLGRTGVGTLELVSASDGLKMRLDPPETQWARDLMVSMKRGDINQMSFGFETLKDSWATQDGQQIRTLEDINLFDVSIVTFPAYPATDAAVRALETAMGRAADDDARLELLQRIQDVLSRSLPQSQARQEPVAPFDAGALMALQRERHLQLIRTKGLL